MHSSELSPDTAHSQFQRISEKFMELRETKLGELLKTWGNMRKDGKKLGVRYLSKYVCLWICGFVYVYVYVYLCICVDSESNSELISPHIHIFSKH